MKHLQSTKAGFTAVELLITLFVAAAFLIAGYQLFNTVIKDGGATRAQSRAANIAYDYMRRYSSSASNPCVASTPVNNMSVDIEGLANPKVTVTINCIPSGITTLSKIEATVTYNDPVKTMRYATYAYKEGSDVTDGLVGWWKFNDDVLTSAGYANGSATATNSTTNKSGQPNNAIALNGTGSYVTISTSLERPTAAFTLSIWYSATNGSAAQKLMGTTQAGGYALQINDPICPTNAVSFSAYIGGAYRAACGDPTPVNSWTHVVGIYTGSSVNIYMNGVLKDTLETSGSMGYGASTVPLCIGSEPSATACNDGAYFAGSLDDSRIYNRALHDNEVLQLYNQGPK